MSRYLSTQQLIMIPTRLNTAPIGTKGAMAEVKKRLFMMLAQRSPISTGCPAMISLVSSSEQLHLSGKCFSFSRFSSFSPQKMSKRLKILDRQLLVMNRKKKSVTRPLQSMGTHLSSLFFMTMMKRLAMKVEMTMLRKKSTDSLLATILKNLLWSLYLSSLALFLITMPSRELNRAATVATPRLDMNTSVEFSPTSFLLIICLINKMMKKHITITAKVPMIIRTFLLCSFRTAMFSHMTSVGSTTSSRCQFQKSLVLTGNLKISITLLTTAFYTLITPLTQLSTLPIHSTKPPPPSASMSKSDSPHLFGTMGQYLITGFLTPTVSKYWSSTILMVLRQTA